MRGRADFEQLLTDIFGDASARDWISDPNEAARAHAAEHCTTSI